jgi:predicted Mrr-cat superfamily restriction endonuclease
VRTILTIILTLLTIAMFAQNPCRKDFIKKVQPGDTIVNNCKTPHVIMAAEVYAEYYHNTKRLEELKKQIPEYKSIIKELEKRNAENRENLDSVLVIKDQIIELEKLSKKDAVATVYEMTEENNKIKHKNSVLKKQRNGAGGIAILTILLILIL